ncbi:MAG: redox-sensitive transcriptional activator SoxR [Rhodobacteraceae bacterium]|nr:redox-sensitive transcriptional activator SoxR [Paracoccaceae bacterium]
MPQRPLRPSGLTIGDVASRTGLAVSAIRYYEDEGLIAPHRSASGQRRFTRADLRRLSFIRIAQALGFPLARIRAVLDTLPGGRPPSKADWTRLSHHFRDDLDARIAQLEALRDKLDGCIGCGCLSLETCALYNDKDRAAAKGSGPRYLMGDSASDP